MRSERPITRADCAEGGSNAQRPCPWVGCRWNLWIETSHGGSGSEKSPPHLPKTDPTSMRYTCALDVAESTGSTRTLEEVGNVLRKTRERVRQIESTAMKKIRKTPAVEKRARDALDLSTMLGGYEFVEPTPGPLFTTAERAAIRRFRPDGRPAPLCKRVGCQRTGRRRKSFTSASPLAGYCSYVCARLARAVQ